MYEVACQFNYFENDANAIIAISMRLKTFMTDKSYIDICTYVCVYIIIYMPLL